MKKVIVAILFILSYAGAVKAFQISSGAIPAQTASCAAASRFSAYSAITGLFTCETTTGADMTYPDAGVPKSTGAGWDTSYAVGTSANNLVQLNGSAQLPAISGANLTGIPASSLTGSVTYAQTSGVQATVSATAPLLFDGSVMSIPASSPTTSGSMSAVDKKKANNWPDMVADYGADNTGVADSTSAFNTAAAAASGKAVYVPAGSYKIDGTFTIDVSNVTFFGPVGRRAAILNFNHATSAIVLGNTSSAQRTDITFANLDMRGIAGQTLVWIKWVRGTHFLNCRITADKFLKIGDPAGYVDETTNRSAYIVTMDDVEAFHVTSPTQHFITADNFSGQFDFRNSFVEGKYHADYDGFYASDNVKARIDHVIIQGGYFSRFRDNWSFVDARVVNFFMSDHTSEEAGRYAVHFESTAGADANVGWEDVTIANSQFGATNNIIRVVSEKSGVGHGDMVFTGITAKSTAVTPIYIQSEAGLISGVNINGLTSTITPSTANEVAVHVKGGISVSTISGVTVDNVGLIVWTTPLTAIVKFEGLFSSSSVGANIVATNATNKVTGIGYVSLADGDVSMANNKAIKAKDTGGTYRSLVTMDAADTQIFGQNNNLLEMKGYRLAFKPSNPAGQVTGEAVSIRPTVDYGSSDEVLQVGDSAADFLTILGNGYSGIGTTAPDAKLHVTGGVCIDTDDACTDPGAGNLRITNDLGVGTDTVFLNGGLINARLISILSPTVDGKAFIEMGSNQTNTSNATGGFVVFNTAIGAADKRIGQFQVATDGATDSGRVNIITWNAGASVQAMAIKADGKTGIGTTAPDKALEVNHATGDNLRLTYNDSNGGAANYTDFALSLSGDLTITPSGGDMTIAGAIQSTKYSLASNCSSSAAPAACSSAAAGSVVIGAGAVDVLVNTTALTANSQILLTADSTLGTKLGVTCNTQSLLVLGTPKVTTRAAGSAFTIAVEVAPTTNPLCISYLIIN